jgi:hypothetical protein
MNLAKKCSAYRFIFDYQKSDNMHINVACLNCLCSSFLDFSERNHTHTLKHIDVTYITV